MSMMEFEPRRERVGVGEVREHGRRVAPADAVDAHPVVVERLRREVDEVEVPAEADADRARGHGDVEARSDAEASGHRPPIGTGSGPVATMRAYFDPEHGIPAAFTVSTVAIELPKKVGALRETPSGSVVAPHPVGKEYVQAGDWSSKSAWARRVMDRTVMASAVLIGAAPGFCHEEGSKRSFTTCSGKGTEERGTPRRSPSASLSPP